ncbi:4Fe-4S dicluster domain-containing protein [Patescibacteria group bacterium]
MEKGATIRHDIKKAANTGSWRNMRPKVEKKGCIGCGTCVKYCPEACIVLRNRRSSEMKSEGRNSEKVAEIGFDFCKGCGVCAEVCPVKVIAMKKD